MVEVKLGNCWENVLWVLIVFEQVALEVYYGKEDPLVKGGGLRVWGWLG